MAMLQLRVVCPPDLVDDVQDLLSAEPGAIAQHSAPSSDGVVVSADVARESAGPLLDALRDRGVLDRGMVTLVPLDTAVGTLAERAEADAPGEGADALIWDDLAARTGEDSILTWTFGAFMVLATVLFTAAARPDRVHLPPGVVLARHRAGRRRRRHALADLQQVRRPGRGLHLGDDDPRGRQRRSRGDGGHWYQTGQSLLQLGINLVGIVLAGVVTLALLQRVQAAPVRTVRAA